MLVYLRQSEDYAAEIRMGKLGYSSRLGWINWNHARPHGVRLFLDDLQSRWRLADGEPFTVSYGQSMSCRWGWLGVESRLSRTYRVTGGLPAAELDRVALGIFREVSEAFEGMQGRFPNALDARSQSSSFRAGDLTGDNIAFYCALHRCSPDVLKEELGLVSVPASLWEFQRKGLHPSRSWSLPTGMDRSSLAQLRHDPEWFAAHTQLLKRTETHFRFYLVS